MATKRGRDIDRPDAPHPAPHHLHSTRHRYFAEERDYLVADYGTYTARCCDKPETHPIHLSSRRNR